MRVLFAMAALLVAVGPTGAQAMPKIRCNVTQYWNGRQQVTVGCWDTKKSPSQWLKCYLNSEPDRNYAVFSCEIPPLAAKAKTKIRCTVSTSLDGSQAKVECTETKNKPPQCTIYQNEGGGNVIFDVELKR